MYRHTQMGNRWAWRYGHCEGDGGAGSSWHDRSRQADKEAGRQIGSTRGPGGQ